MRRILTGAPAVVVVALVLRVGLVAATPAYVPSGDPISYDRQAAYLVAHGTYTPSEHADATSPAAYRPPAWPYLLAGVYKVTGGRWTAGRLAAAGLGTLTVLLVLLVAGEALGAAAGRTAGWMAAVFPPMVFLSGSLVAENLFVPLLLASAWAVLRARRSATPWRWAVLAGACCGLAALTRTNGLGLAVPLALALLPTLRPRSLRPSGLALPVVAVVAMAVVISPWTVRNAKALHAFVPVSTQSGYTEAAVWNPTSAAPGPDLGRPQYVHIEPLLHRPGVDEVALSRELGRIGRRFAYHHPRYVLDVLRLNLLRSFKLASSHGTFAYYWNRERNMTPPMRVLDSLGLAVGVALALLALARRAGRRRLRAAPFWLWLFGLVTFASTVFLLGNPRYRTSLDPFIVMLAAVAVGERLWRVRAAPRSGRSRAAGAR